MVVVAVGSGTGGTGGIGGGGGAEELSGTVVDGVSGATDVLDGNVCEDVDAPRVCERTGIREGGSVEVEACG